MHSAAQPQLTAEKQDVIAEEQTLTVEERALVAIQHAARPFPWMVKAAQGLSLFGEHSAGWVALSALGYVTQPARKNDWLVTGLAAFGAHVASVIIKRIVRRPRPNNPRINVNVKTPSQLSFPSSHATSTTAWAVGAAIIARTPLPLLLAPIMMFSRMLAGVHYPTDVTAGALLGGATSIFMHKLGKTTIANHLVD